MKPDRQNQIEESENPNVELCTRMNEIIIILKGSETSFVRSHKDQQPHTIEEILRRKFKGPSRI